MTERAQEKEPLDQGMTNTKPSHQGSDTKAPTPPSEKMSYYDEIAISPSPDDPRYLVYIASKGAAPPPDDLISLRNGFSQVARIVRILFNDDLPTRRHLFDNLHRAADRALRGPEYSIVDGASNLADVREMVTDLALKIRSDRFQHYNKLLCWLGVLPALLGFILLKTEGFGFKSSLSIANFDIVDLAVVSLLLVSGATICVWAEFVLRVHDDLDFDQLLKLDLGRWQPGQRVVITIVVSFIFAFLLRYNVVQVGLGGLLLNDFTRTPEFALAIGGVTGFAFPAVRDIMYRLKPEERH